MLFKLLILQNTMATKTVIWSSLFPDWEFSWDCGHVRSESGGSTSGSAANGDRWTISAPINSFNKHSFINILLKMFLYSNAWVFWSVRTSVCVFGNGDSWCLWGCETGREAAEQKHSSDWMLSPSQVSSAVTWSFTHVTSSWGSIWKHGRPGKSAAGASLIQL